jgi:Ca2+-binding EF-hand superfamily protein
LCLDKDELLLRSFHVFDKDNSGFITEQELREAMCCKGGQVGGRGRGVLKRQAL